MKYLEFDTPGTEQAGDLKSRYGLSNHGLIHLDRVFWNLPAAALIEEATFRKEGTSPTAARWSSTPARGRARRPGQVHRARGLDRGPDLVGEYNRPYDAEKFSALFARVQAFLQDEELFVQDCYVGADPEYRMPIRSSPSTPGTRCSPATCSSGRPPSTSTRATSPSSR